MQVAIISYLRPKCKSCFENVLKIKLWITGLTQFCGLLGERSIDSVALPKLMIDNARTPTHSYGNYVYMSKAVLTYTWVVTLNFFTITFTPCYK